MAFPPNFSNNWDVTFPPDTQLANLLGQDLRQVRTDVMQRMSLLSGTLANRPTPEIVNATWGGAGFGLIYFSTDTNQLFQWNGAAWIDITSSISGKYKFIGSNIVPATVGNTAVPGTLQSINVSANDFGPGQTFYIDCYGLISTVAGIAITIGVQLASGPSIGSIAIAPGTQVNQGWSLRGFFTGLTAGVGGTVTQMNPLFYSFVVGGVASPGNPGLSFVVDTTVGQTVRLTAAWGAANPGATITQNTMTIYRVG